MTPDDLKMIRCSRYDEPVVVESVCFMAFYLAGHESACTALPVSC